ncbi:hypothetical protein L2E82_10262 [Cichorium intybus]|uniref:Uncharacterized protein n=1 Tax=Cichorium intybus TaxID=13427 RepID=A0ACB9GA48_CICIN|nr:hypothetical protein L2E82_10262 [Cichorium intybus]
MEKYPTVVSANNVPTKIRIDCIDEAFSLSILSVGSNSNRGWNITLSTYQFSGKLTQETMQNDVVVTHELPTNLQVKKFN